MKFTPGQIRDIVGISAETFRHWKRVLLPLEGRNGYQPCFTHGDILAMGIVKSVVEGAAVRVGALTDIADDLFALCNEISWTALERSVFTIDLTQRSVVRDAENLILRPTNAVIVIPCRPIVEQLRERLLAAASGDVQGQLNFPPTPVTATRSGTANRR